MGRPDSAPNPADRAPPDRTPAGFAAWKVPSRFERSCQRSSISLASRASYRNGGLSSFIGPPICQRETKSPSPGLRREDPGFQAGEETPLHLPLECQCDVIPLTCPQEPSGHLHQLVRNCGRACRGCAGRLPGCRAGEPRTDSATAGRGWNPALQGGGGCQAASVTSRRADSPVVFAPAGSGTRRRQGRRQVRSGERSLGRTDRGACHGGGQRAGPVAVAGLAWVRVTYDPMVATISTGERRGAPTRSPTPDRASIQAGRETAGIRCMYPPWKRLIWDKRR